MQNNSNVLRDGSEARVLRSLRPNEWGDRPPATDDEAIQRILEATRHCIDTQGLGTSIADVAQVLGVTEWALSPYFDSTEDLLNAFTIEWTATSFIDELVAHVAHLHEPAEVIVEWIAFSIEQLISESYLGVLLYSGRVSAFATGITSEAGITMGHRIVERFSVDWQNAGFDDQLLTELIEYVLRTIESLIFCPVQPERDAGALRRYLTRWVAPAIHSYTRQA